MSTSPAERRPCPMCGRPASQDGPSRPFCSRRCKLADLGNWLDERYRIPAGLGERPGLDPN